LHQCGLQCSKAEALDNQGTKVRCPAIGNIGEKSQKEEEIKFWVFEGLKSLSAIEPVQQEA
jgi:hypothetical protein